MDLLSQLPWFQIFSWLVLILGLIALAYTMLVIREEKDAYTDSAVLKQLHRFDLLTPSWWNTKKFDANSITFYRADTHYDWYSKFEVLIAPDMSVTKIMKDFLEGENIDLDENEIIITTDPSHIFKNLKLIDEIESMIRIEGTATQNLEERIYLDYLIIKLRNSDEFLQASSHSSVLNGGVEGPYFEEIIKRLELLS